jgi:mersacidin/lichenicidin family type 2 lantibiotic
VSFSTDAAESNTPKEDIMSRLDIVRAWKDQAFRNSLSAEQRALLPGNPAGTVELSDLEAATVEGKVAYASCSGCHCAATFQQVAAK